MIRDDDEHDVKRMIAGFAAGAATTADPDGHRADSFFSPFSSPRYVHQSVHQSRLRLNRKPAVSHVSEDGGGRIILL